MFLSTCMNSLPCVGGTVCKLPLLSNPLTALVDLSGLANFQPLVGRTKKEVCRNKRCTFFFFVNYKRKVRYLQAAIFWRFFWFMCSLHQKKAAVSSQNSLISQSMPSFLIFAHNFFILKAMARKEKSIKTLSFQNGGNVCSSCYILSARTRLPVLCIFAPCVSALPRSRATLWLFACISWACGSVLSSCPLLL